MSLPVEYPYKWLRYDLSDDLVHLMNTMICAVEAEWLDDMAQRAAGGGS